MTAHANPLPPLLSPRELELLRLRVLEMRDRQRRAATAPDIGSHRSSFRGQGMELYDVRPYQPGDDIRHLDWRATARSGKPISKVFIEERARRLLLIIDRRTPMLFGTRHELKITTAARVTALLLFGALAAREDAGGLLLDTAVRRFPDVRHLDQALSLLSAVCAAPPQSSEPVTSLPQLLHDLLYQVSANTAIYIISDLHDVDIRDTRLWSQLGERLNAHVVQVLDSAEEQLEDSGPIRLTSPLTGQTVLIDSHDDNLRTAYADAAEQRGRDLARLFAGAGIHTRKVYTHQDAFEIIGDWL